MKLKLEPSTIYENNLDTDKFSRMLDDPSQCYKFYWLEAILRLTVATEEDLTFEQIIDEMICQAWYSATRFHLRLGPAINGKAENYLEHAVKIAAQDAMLSEVPSREEILAAISRQKEALKDDKYQLTLNVPYRLLSSFLDEIKGSDPIWRQSRRLICLMNQLNEEKHFLYTIINGRGVEKKIHINLYWRQIPYMWREIPERGLHLSWNKI